MAMIELRVSKIYCSPPANAEMISTSSKWASIPASKSDFKGKLCRMAGVPSTRAQIFYQCFSYMAFWPRAAIRLLCLDTSLSSAWACSRTSSFWSLQCFDFNFISSDSLSFTVWQISAAFCSLKLSLYQCFFWSAKTCLMVQSLCLKLNLISNCSISGIFVISSFKVS